MRKITFGLMFGGVVVGGLLLPTQGFAFTVSCGFTSPQAVIVDGVAHVCGTDRPWCNNEKAPQGIAQCCAAAGPYQDCVTAGPVLVPHPAASKMLWSTDVWYVGGGYSVNATLWNEATGQARITFSKDGSKLHEQLVAQGQSYVYHDPVKNYDVFSTTVSGYGVGGVSTVGLSGTKVSSLVFGAVTEFAPPGMAVQLSGQGGNVKQFLTGETWEITGRFKLYVETTNSVSNPKTVHLILLDDCKKVDEKTVNAYSLYRYGDILNVLVQAIQPSGGRDSVEFSLTQLSTAHDTFRSPGKIEQWSCGEWSACTNGRQSRACTDANACYFGRNQPFTEQDCTSCTESWTCGEWSACTGGEQTRTCTDANSCGTRLTMPATAQGCTAAACVESWSCSEWSVCAYSQQARLCGDVNACGTERDKPATAQSCQVVPILVPLPTPTESPAPTPSPTIVSPPAPDTWAAQEKVRVTQVDHKLAQRLKGRIVLQVEERGEAWYVNPTTEEKYYLRDGAVAYAALRRFGLGVRNVDLAKIPVGLEDRFVDTDADGDGLADKLEEGLKTDPGNADSDGDGQLDGVEVRNGYNPLGPGKLNADSKLVGRLSGKILLQVESRGEAWYLNPADGKRYYLKDGDAAYQIMRFLSLGIANSNLRKIKVGEL